MDRKKALEDQIRIHRHYISFYEKKLYSLPKGAVQSKVINGKTIHYLRCWNEGEKRLEEDIIKEEFEIIKHELKMRKHIERWIRELYEDIEIIKQNLKEAYNQQTITLFKKEEF